MENHIWSLDHLVSQSPEYFLNGRIIKFYVFFKYFPLLTLTQRRWQCEVTGVFYHCHLFRGLFSLGRPSHTLFSNIMQWHRGLHGPILHLSQSRKVYLIETPTGEKGVALCILLMESESAVLIQLVWRNSLDKWRNNTIWMTIDLERTHTC